MEVSSGTMRSTSRTATRGRGRPAQALYMPPARRHRGPATKCEDMRPEKHSPNTPPSPANEPKIFSEVTIHNATVPSIVQEKFVDLCINNSIKDITNNCLKLPENKTEKDSRVEENMLTSNPPKVISLIVENTKPAEILKQEDKSPRKEEVRVKSRQTKVKCDVLPISLAKNIKKSPIKLVQVDQWEDLVNSDDEPASPDTPVQNHKTVISKYDDDDVEECEGLSNDLVEHILEIYDFPSTFKTPDIMQIYNEMDQESMYIKWLNDTRALLVLGSAMQAKRALSIENPFLKSRPVALGSHLALEAVRQANLRPAMKRPQTSMQAARRMITTALGAKSNVSREVQQRERDALRRAKEEKRAQRQNERDAWDGNPRPTTA